MALPEGVGSPSSRWVVVSRLHPLVPESRPAGASYTEVAPPSRAGSGRLKHDWALAPLRVREVERLALHSDLPIPANLACALARARAVPLAT